ncbi:unnamed protein product [Didymodactylos carnosus]|uniref:Uncharacterized protein n=1 Tax=Didymodactylos carnosus TaxID=1234261 RepID=A0A815N659_9BILA|nr:unnamed protein product [Didymodactylos carnosus]CAF4312450.1 unnamed protein product [Didymodactylos carnosus]
MISVARTMCGSNPGQCLRLDDVCVYNATVCHGFSQYSLSYTSPVQLCNGVCYDTTVQTCAHSVIRCKYDPNYSDCSYPNSGSTGSGFPTIVVLIPSLVVITCICPILVPACLGLRARKTRAATMEGPPPPAPESMATVTVIEMDPFQNLPPPRFSQLSIREELVPPTYDDAIAAEKRKKEEENNTRNNNNDANDLVAPQTAVTLRL